MWGSHRLRRECTGRGRARSRTPVHDRRVSATPAGRVVREYCVGRVDGSRRPTRPCRGVPPLPFDTRVVEGDRRTRDGDGTVGPWVRATHRVGAALFRRGRTPAGVPVPSPKPRGAKEGDGAGTETSAGPRCLPSAPPSDPRPTSGSKDRSGAPRPSTTPSGRVRKDGGGGGGSARTLGPVVPPHPSNHPLSFGEGGIRDLYVS